MSIALIFPGQGSQQVGMGRALADSFAAARAVFEEVDAALGESLSTVIFEGPEDRLTLTANAQPALMAVSLAALRVLEAETGLDVARHAAFVAGHSLGEYSALAAAGSLSVSDAARLLRVRGDAMQKAVPVGEGAMAALLGLDLDVAREIAAEAAERDVCAAANDNAPGQVVISGSKAAVERAIALAKPKGAKRAVLLPVSAPFHCALMQPAAEAMREALAGVAIAAPRAPLVANVTAGPLTVPEAISARRAGQLDGAVRWRESMGFMAGAGVTHFVEIGAGKVLADLVKRNAEGATGESVGTPEDVARVAAAGTFVGNA
ncbi:ACP S-malonyltransferase [Methylopila musalis]|uniref:Malonyl CoA-acyl carrier protein transacylase n=1 Tax=Methylopila musalis TaxID=1134781 RepID=A0ABW3Z9V4_9HYPH